MTSLVQSTNSTQTVNSSQNSTSTQIVNSSTESKVEQKKIQFKNIKDVITALKQLEIDYVASLQQYRLSGKNITKMNHPHAKMVLGKYNLALFFKYIKGCCVEKNTKIAREHFLKAVEYEFGMAQYYLGYFYEQGIGFKKNEKLAVLYYKKSAAQKYSEALFKLGSLYETGTNIDKNEKFAFECYKRAADKKNVRALYRVGVCYDFGIGTSVNHENAVRCYTMASDMGYSGAQWNLGKCYYGGIGIKKDEKLGLELMEKSIKEASMEQLTLIANEFKITIGKDSQPSRTFYQESIQKVLNIQKEQFSLSNNTNSNSTTIVNT